MSLEQFHMKEQVSVNLPSMTYNTLEHFTQQNMKFY